MPLETSSKKASTVRQKMWLCLFGNLATLVIVSSLVVVFRDETSSYLRFGPQPDLVLVSVRIDSWWKWTATLATIGFLRVGEVLVNEIGSPILAFNVYNPDKTVITDFSYRELHFLANAMWAINGLRQVFMAMVAITQIDLAFASVVVSELASVYTVGLLLAEKQFEPAGFKPVVTTSDVDV